MKYFKVLTESYFYDKCNTPAVGSTWLKVEKESDVDRLILPFILKNDKKCFTTDQYGLLVLEEDFNEINYLFIDSHNEKEFFTYTEIDKVEYNRLKLIIEQYNLEL